MNEETKSTEGTSPEASERRAAQLGPALAMLEETMEEILEAASVKRVFGEPVQQDGTLIIPVAEVAGRLGFGGGFGSGMAKRARQKMRQGAGPAGRPSEEAEQPLPEAAGEKPGPPEEGGGGGGGGRVNARPVAVVVASAGDVRVEPVVDKTKIALTAIITNAIAGVLVIRMIKKAIARR